ncbi:chemotaxis protein CheV [Lachnospiraceae bacterium KM106-2]|nr:chemotaxis protein CheV [Lachnospiraceae bacterium KM106-2]
MDTGILLESGTNELEILEFTVGGNHYGINVAKIKEILPYKKPTPVPNAHPSIEGIFMPRDQIISIVDLAVSLKLPASKNPSTDMYIVTSFNQINTAFHVHGVSGIHRVSWNDISKPDSTISTDGASVATGIIKIQDKLIIILDFEKIVADISPETSLKISDLDMYDGSKRKDAPLIITEDSPLLGQLIYDCLHKAGYTNVTRMNNGAEAWELLKKYKAEGNPADKVACLITDIEMPQMDGHHLTKLIKDDDQLKSIPVVIFSSLVNEEMYRKGEAVGANMQLSKPEIGKLVHAIDSLVLK